MSDLIFISENECLVDVDSGAWAQLIENRGGCKCFISPPCFACCEPVTEAELNEVGFSFNPLSDA